MKKQTVLIIASILGLALAAGATILVRDSGAVRANIHAVSSDAACPLSESACCASEKEASCDLAAKTEGACEDKEAACPLSAKTECQGE